MSVDPNAAITIAAFDWVPEFARGQVRDLRVRWAVEETGQDYAVRYLPQGCQKKAAHRASQPSGQVLTYEDSDVTLLERGAIVCPAFRQALADHMAGFTGHPPSGPDERTAEHHPKQGVLT